MESLIWTSSLLEILKKDIVGFESSKRENPHDNRFGASMLASFKLERRDNFKNLS
jgi:hypothetical protein